MFLIYFLRISYSIFLSDFSPTPTPPWFPVTSLPTQLHFFLFCNNNKKKPWGVQFVLVDYSWALGPSRNVVDIPSATPLKKTDFPSPSNCQFPTASWWGAGHHALFPSMLGFCLARSCAHPVHAFTVCVFICTSAPLGLENAASLESPAPHPALTVFLSPF